MEIKITGDELKGNVLSLKNNKFIAQGRMITKPEAYKQQKRIVGCIESQLELALAEEYAKTSTEQLEPSSTAWCELAEELLTRLPQDDNFLVVNEIHAYGELVDKGKEFIAIHIERI